MNIFKSLSQGNGSISETNITSFLSYLLNSTNELDNSFILLFLELIDKNPLAFWLVQMPVVALLTYIGIWFFKNSISNAR